MEYFLLKPNGEQTGTFSIDEVRSMLNKGVIGPDTRFWHDGITEWLPVSRIEEYVHFQSILSSPKTPPPAPMMPLTMSGSLARAIPSPHHKTKSLPKIDAKPTTPKVEIPTRKEEPVAPVIPVQPRREPEPVLEPESADAWDTPEEQEPEHEVPPPVEIERPPRDPRAVGRMIAALSLLALAVAIAFGARILSKTLDPFGHVRLTGTSVFVLMDQGSIKSYENDMSSSASAESLKLRISQSEDPIFKAKLQIALDQENNHHPEEITQQYIEEGKAQNIEPGRYRALGYFDDDGHIIIPREGEAWVAIVYKDGIVFAHKEAAP